MSLTPEQRAEQSRKNGQKSQGPKTTEGKTRSHATKLKQRPACRRNSPIAGEDPGIAQARASAWNDYYQPQSPAAHHLVNECARATLQADRLEKFQVEAIDRQREEAAKAWSEERGKEVARAVETLRSDPDGARRTLMSTAAGCRWLIERWEKLELDLQRAAGRGRIARPPRSCACSEASRPTRMPGSRASPPRRLIRARSTTPCARLLLRHGSAFWNLCVRSHHPEQFAQSRQIPRLARRTDRGGTRNAPHARERALRDSETGACRIA